MAGSQFTQSGEAPAFNSEGTITQIHVTRTIVFAAVFMIVAGSFHILQGLAAIINGEFFAVVSNYAYNLDIEFWGWFHLLAGVCIVLAGVGLLSGSVWARLFAMLLVVVSAMINFIYIPFQPFWAIVLLVIDGIILSALLNEGNFEAEASR